MRTFPCKIIANEYEVRFAFGGKVSWVGKNVGETVKKGEPIASLDKKILQTELDRQLADYEKTRGEFELFNLKPGEGGDVEKYTRQVKQAILNASIRDVELTKYKLDQVSIFSPVTGFISDLDGLIPGLYITPANNTITVIDTDSIRVQFEIKQSDLPVFASSQKVTITTAGLDKVYSGQTSLQKVGKEGVFTIFVDPEDKTGLIVGMEGEVSLDIT